MIIINMETLESGENIMEDSGEQKKNLESVIMEKDTNANESTKKMSEINSAITISEQSQESELKTATKKVTGNVSNEPKVEDKEEEFIRKENETDTEKLENSKIENKLNISDNDICKSASKEMQSLESRLSPPSDGKDLKINGEEIKGESMAKEGRRKRRISSVQGTDSSVEKNERINKRKRSKSNGDKFCWRCHKESVDSHCTACPRSWHRRCMGGGPQPSSQNWICGECATILKAENAETRSPAMAQLSVDQLCTLLKHVVGRMRDYPGSEPFWKAVDLNEVPNYLDYVVKPMDLNLLESNVRAKLYGSTEAFMADAKWIQHNCIVFNTCGGVYTDTTKLTNAARQIIKAARQEVSEIEACPDCYGHARNLPRPQPSWFIEPCRRPHPLVWAKLKGFPFWPAKVMFRVNGQGHVDVRFFGAHDRAWVPPRDLYLYSENPPAPLPRKRKSDMDECVREITRHCRKLESTFGQFKFAPPKIQYNPRDPSQIKLMLPNYDPLQSNNSLVSLNDSPRRKTPLRKRAQINKKKSLNKESVTNNTSDSANDSMTPKGDSGSDCEKYIEVSRIPKVQSLSNKRKQSESLTPSKCNDDRNISHNSPGNDNFFKEQKVDKESSNSITLNNVENLENSLKTDDETRIDQENRSIDKNNDEHSSSENEVPLEIRQSLRSSGIFSPKGEAKTTEKKIKSHNTEHSEAGSTKTKNSPKTNRNQVRVYKPKTRMVNQVNAERAKATASNERQELIECIDNVNRREEQTVTSHLAFATVSPKSTDTTSNSATTSTIITNSLSVPKNPIMTITNSTIDSNLLTTNFGHSLYPIPTVMNTGAMTESPMASNLLINSNSLEPGKKVKAMKECFSMNEAIAVIKQEPKEQMQHQPQKKESKARKSFLNRPPVFPQIPPSSPPKAPASPPDAMVYIPGHRTENESDYLLLPPEAGPLSAQLHRGAQELTRRMAQLMEEAFAEAAQIKSNHPDNSELNQGAMVHHLKLQIERMRWQHQQHLAELKHNTDLTFREMKASLEAERHRAVEETKREAEEERLRSIEETKRKQWCALCGNEALFYCCWNTAYCDYPCQQAHWSTHMKTCAQNPPPNTVITATANVSPQQVMPRLVITSPHASSNVWGA